VETGLSSDPEMNWRVSSLDRYRLVSNSDAHSPAALGREATVLRGPLDYYAVRDGLRSGAALAGTLEFFPEEGKYHADGHRACGINWEPARTRAAGGRCPECGKPLTVGVLSRVEDLADRPAGHRPDRAPTVTHLVQLGQVLGEIEGVGAKSKTVEARLNELIAALGAELHILRTAPLDDVIHAGGELLGEAIRRLRRGEVRRIPGFDGEYGIIRLFEPDELRRTESDALFDVPPVVPKPRRAPTRREPVDQPAHQIMKEPPLAPEPSPHEPLEPMLAGMEEVGTGLLDRLDAMQRVAASAPGGPMLIVAGPGTGKTRTLTHRIAYLCAELHVYPEHCLAITFTRRAAEELRQRLDGLLGPVAQDVTVTTFHSLGLVILRENAEAAGLSPEFRIAEEADRIAALVAAGAPSEAAARRQLGGRIDDALAERYAKALRARDLVDLDELVTLPVALLRDSPALVERYRDRWSWVFVDEYQDVDAAQYELLRFLVPADGNLCAIGDPDQAIYSFRGADVQFFLRFAKDYKDARVVRLTRNYRSSAPIVAAAVQAIAPSTLVPGRRLDPARLDPEAVPIGLYPAGSPADEADFVVRTVDELVGGLSHRSLDSNRIDRHATPGSLSFADIAVLYRTDAQAATIVDALARAGVPVQKRSHNRLRDRAGVGAIARELRYATGLAGSLAARVRLTGQVLAERPPLDDAPAPEDIHAAVELLTPLAVRCGDDLERFLSEIATGAEVDALDPRAEAVTLLTLHAAKGLEFPVVFLVGVEDGLLPLRFPGASRRGANAPTAPRTGSGAAGAVDETDKADETSQAAGADETGQAGWEPGATGAANSLDKNDPETAEERRLFFVGLTRAQDRLYLSHARRRFRHGSERDAVPSPFLTAIDPGLLERRGDDAPRRPRDRQLRLL
jgi:superfamily I DNA/RNA helicase